VKDDVARKKPARSKGASARRRLLEDEEKRRWLKTNVFLDRPVPEWIVDEVLLEWHHARHLDRLDPHRKASSRRLLPRWPDLIDEEDWRKANDSLDWAQRHWTWYKVLLASGAAQPEGLHLCQADCWALMHLLRDKYDEGRLGRSHLTPEEIEARDQFVAAYSFLLEVEGGPTKNAIADAARIYDVQRSTVFAARRRWPPPEETIQRWRHDPERRQLQRRLHEAAAPLFQSN
jgi:hypothetical protein